MSEVPQYEPHHYDCRSCGSHVVECILECPCVESQICEECAADGRIPFVKIEVPDDPPGPAVVA